MMSLGRSVRMLAAACAAVATLTACHPTFVVVPAPQDSVADTLDTPTGRPLRPPTRRAATDTVLLTDTVVRTDTVRVLAPGTGIRVDTVVRTDTVIRYRTVVRSDTVVRVDTVVRLAPPAPPTVRIDTIVETDTITRVDTVVVRAPDSNRPGPRPPPRVDTVIQVDTIIIRAPSVSRPGSQPPPRVDTVTVTDTVTNTVTDTVTVIRTDTVTNTVTNTVTLTDTVTITRTDTVTVTRTDTVTLPGPVKRMLFLPPGHFPPQGQCRVWIHGLPPGQQAAAAPCDALGSIPAEAFVLFGGEAWDFDYDWLSEAGREPGSVPPEIIALQRRGG